MIFKNIKKQWMKNLLLLITLRKGVEKGLILFKCITENDLEFNVRPRGSHDYRRELFQNGDSLIGQKLTVIFQEYSADGIPRFPVGKAIRYDK